MLIPVYAVSSCYNPAIVDESTTTRNPPGQITGLDDRRLLHHHDSYLGNVKQKLVYPFIENENCRHNLSCFVFYLPWNFSEACIVTTDDTIHTSVCQSAF
jgi:hypothetical protein